MIMRNILSILAVSIFVLLTACTNEEKDIFPDSATNRLHKAVAESQDVLRSSEKGWVMDYFTNNESDGFTLLCKFDSSGLATAACAHYLTGYRYAEESGLYDIIEDNGPVLTFNSYNDVIHLFSDPAISNQYPMGTGLGGDYEFKVMELGSDLIILEGKKRKVKILLTRYTEDITWKEYLTEINKLDLEMFSKASPSLNMDINGTSFKFKQGYTHIFQISPEETTNNSSVAAPFIITRTGLRFSNPVVLDGQSFQSFRFSDDKSELICIENPELKITGPNVNEFLDESRVLWNVDKNAMSSDFVEKYTKLEAALKKELKGSKVQMGIRSRGNNTLALYMSISVGSTGSKFEANVYMDSKLSENDKLTLSHTGNLDNNAAALYSKIEELRDFVAYFSGNIQLSPNNNFNPTTMKMEWIEHSENSWIEITFN